MNDKLLIYTQISVHLGCFIASFYIIWPISNHMKDFCSHCALFSCGTYIESDGSFEPNWASKGFCIYSILIGLFTLFQSLGQLFFKLRLLYRVGECSFTHAAIDFLLDCLSAILVLASSIIISAGSYRWCDCVQQRFSSCDIAASVMQISNGVNATCMIDATNFSFQLETSQFGIWTLFVVSIVRLMFSTKKVFILHEQENLIVSMARERFRHQNNYS
ncbi:hypothetical protein BLOT_005278 [Blomia tropicalis]|nr:hypothetical protein BLOT_005278 [Blomia tropicalis]